MQRTKKKTIQKADLILTGDWHLQEKQPVARTDDFWQTQWEKVAFISELQAKHDCPIIHSGDLFDYWKPSPMLLAKTIESLPDNFYTIYGNHDLPQHNLELAYKCGVYVLWKAGKLGILKEAHWNTIPEFGTMTKREFGLDIGTGVQHNLLVWHVMTYQGKKPWPGCEDSDALRLLKKYPEYDLIVTGHNHIPFVEEYKGRLLVNPGSIFRLTASQEDHKPRVYLWYSETNTVEPVYLPIEKNVINKEHIVNKKERDTRLTAFIETLNVDYKVSLSFEQNLERFVKKNNTPKEIIELIYEAMEL